MVRDPVSVAAKASSCSPSSWSAAVFSRDSGRKGLTRSVAVSHSRWIFHVPLAVQIRWRSAFCARHLPAASYAQGSNERLSGGEPYFANTDFGEAFLVRLRVLARPGPVKHLALSILVHLFIRCQCLIRGRFVGQVGRFSVRGCGRFEFRSVRQFRRWRCDFLCGLRC